MTLALARQPMLALGCIQAQQCHTGHCPTGVATHNRWRVRGLDPTDKTSRVANDLMTLRKETMWLVRALGVAQPGEVTLEHSEVLAPGYQSRPAAEVFGRTGGTS